MNDGKTSSIEIINKEKQRNLETKMDRLMNAHLKDFEKVDKIYLTNATTEDLMKYVQEYNAFF